MGLDAKVYCDCFERGALKVPPRPEWRVHIEDNGCRASAAADQGLQAAFWNWSQDQACPHEDGMLVHHYLGNIALVAFLRKVLGEQPELFPLITGKVIYDGIHCGDYLTLGEVETLEPEVERLSRLHVSDPEDERFVREFETQMRELVECALRIGKPIAF